MIYNILESEELDEETKKLAKTHDIDDIVSVWVKINTNIIEDRMTFTIKRRHANGEVSQFGNTITTDLDGKKTIALISAEIKRAADNYTPTWKKKEGVSYIEGTQTGNEIPVAPVSEGREQDL